MNSHPCLLAGIWGTDSNFEVASESRNGVMSNFSNKKQGQPSSQICAGDPGTVSRIAGDTAWPQKEPRILDIAGGEDRPPCRERISSEV